MGKQMVCEQMEQVKPTAVSQADRLMSLTAKLLFDDAQWKPSHRWEKGWDFDQPVQARSYEDRPGTCRLPLQLPSDHCWRLGMIVYELITNSARQPSPMAAAQSGWSCIERVRTSNAASSTTDRPQPQFSLGTGSELSASWPEPSPGVSSISLDRTNKVHPDHSVVPRAAEKRPRTNPVVEGNRDTAGIPGRQEK
jgi:hypothetical protein